ncbi:hypothetical protein SAMN04489761_0067 [Tenacibaculum sp. MAR_2009_124]|uniref:hypothetical protein n=1 Tax=Tenacibaculum sp. MAR_2009_124 TaxID=1250059 RepID=UPI0008958272|nr:hypothetical protein [Tenacibaculum sp. MAR_2009_124]SEB35532.1 hypothetical protein SAMN04489761_0067 [Tenacibaculum sp. MAR_2009_124]
MKKSFFLSKGLEKFTDFQVNDLNNITGGAEDIPVDVYYPTGGGRRCPHGQVWSDRLGKCVNYIEAAEVSHKLV